MVNSIKKGKAFEREVAKLLSERTGVKWQRVPYSGAMATSLQLSDKNFKGDLFTEDLGFSRWHIECKITGQKLTIETLLSQKSLIWEWWLQASQESYSEETDRIPVLIFRFPMSPVFVLTSDIHVVGDLQSKMLLHITTREGEQLILARLTD